MVAPLVGAWIEIGILCAYGCLTVVAPLVGAWIEIVSLAIVALIITVAPLVGAWIEMELVNSTFYKSIRSLLSWERGLKFDEIAILFSKGYSRSSRGSVD